MELRDFIKKLIRNYFTIFALIVICVTISRQIFSTYGYIELKEIYIYMICSAMTDLTSLILYSQKEISEREMWIRRIIHFIVLEVVLLIFANVVGHVNRILDIVVLELQIAVIYVICSYLSWMYDKKATNKINERLNKMREASRAEQEEG